MEKLGKTRNSPSRKQLILHSFLLLRHLVGNIASNLHGLEVMLQLMCST